ncbi:gamma-glutamylcyclotransferase family protein [Algibacter lectus]|uniref:gamma-glutamylcyclotransferase family protein n=1 Tax=Algibacter lectus TaxID=221126 RepID=UPI0026F0F2EB|nr:gamma-glutamylcyclotransferase family protein [Algibacter lectus]MDO7138899.1 gamma-glutamylcyclotransferase family protein [Algibacter lectus]
MHSKAHYLFSYGTLQLEKVQIETYNRKLIGFKDTLENYTIEQLKITDKDVLAISQKQFHPIATPSKYKKNCIEGVIFEITEQELIQTDNYKVSDYKRIIETFKSGKKAWIYISNKKRMSV